MTARQLAEELADNVAIVVSFERIGSAFESRRATEQRECAAQLEPIIDKHLARLTAEVARLRELVQHCWVHSSYRNCGVSQMTTEQAELFRSITFDAALQEAPHAD